MQPTPPRDFSGKKRDVRFTADGDTFTGVERVPTTPMANIVVRINASSKMEEKVAAVIDFFDICLLDESAALMRKRLGDKENPIDLEQAMDIIGYLVEVYGARPTEPSASSSAGSPTEVTGTSLTAGVPSVTSTPETSHSTAS